MHLTQLSLKNFRSYTDLELELSPTTNIFIGENGEGKTNIIEAVMYLALLSSHRVSGDQPLIQLNSERAYIRAKIQNEERSALLELEINPGRANRAKVNQNSVKSQREIFGYLKAICFSPEDLDLVRGDPSERRKFLDQILIQHHPRMAGVVADYDRALKQRNSLLKSRAPKATLEPWNQHLANFGSEVIAERINLINKLTPHFVEAYKDISKKKVAALSYKSSIQNPTSDKNLNKIEILNKMEELQEQERDRGASLIGPHRDDLLINLGEHPVKGYASHGESWSIALSLKLGSYKLFIHDGEKPILILDDVFSELDEERRANLTKLVLTAEQSFITVAVDKDLPKNITGKKFFVTTGNVKPL
jgi:DNA replication and repair protein RecF